MKAVAKRFSFLTCIFGAVLQLHAQGYIVTDGVRFGFGYTPIRESTIAVVQNPVLGDYTYFFLENQGANTFLFGSHLDEGVRVFLLSPNDPVSLQPVLSHNYTELGSTPNYTFSLDTPFYVGLYTGYSPWDSQGNYTGIYSDPVFGWAELKNDGGTIKLLDSAVAYGADGIYAGTRTLITIPEPSTFVLTAFGSLFLGLRRRAKPGRCVRHVSGSL